MEKQRSITELRDIAAMLDEKFAGETFGEVSEYCNENEDEEACRLINEFNMYSCMGANVFLSDSSASDFFGGENAWEKANGLFFEDVRDEEGCPLMGYDEKNDVYWNYFDYGDRESEYGQLFDGDVVEGFSVCNTKDGYEVFMILGETEADLKARLIDEYGGVPHEADDEEE